MVSNNIIYGLGNLTEIVHMLSRSQRMQRHLLESGHLLGSRLVRLTADSSQNLQLRQGPLSSPTLYHCFVIR
jgi:hypothetical protein